MAGFTGSNRFGALNRSPNIPYSGSGFSIAGGNSFGAVPQGFGGVGSLPPGGFSNFNNNPYNTGFGGGFNNNPFSNPYSSFGGGGFNSFGGGFNSFGGGFNSFGGGGGGYQLGLMLGSMIPGLLQGLFKGLQNIFQGRFQRRFQGGGHNCQQLCSQGHPDVSNQNTSYINGQTDHRIDETGVNMSFDMDYS